MSWKNIKDHYRIGHTVQIRDGIIAIGSSYVSDLIRVTLDGKLSWGNLGECSSNADLIRYYKEMSADLDKLRELVTTPDTFAKSLPVFTWEGGEIIEKQCEEYGYPNVTHDGLLQYENTFSPDRQQVIAWAKEDARDGVKYGMENLEREAERFARYSQRLTEARETLAKLEKQFPDPEPQPSPDLPEDSIPLTPELLDALMPPGEYVHTLVSTDDGTLLGADWKRSEILEAAAARGIERSGQMARAMNHAAAIRNELNTPVFVATIRS